MSQSIISILVKAINIVTQNQDFRNRWVAQSSFIKGLTGKFAFKTDINARTFTKAFTIACPTCDNLLVKNDVGYFRSIKGQNRYLFFQKKFKTPPMLPSFRKQKKEWDDIVRIDEEQLSFYLHNVEKERDRSLRPNKRKRFHEVDDIQISFDAKKQNDIAVCSKPITPTASNYWNSDEAKKLFNPSPNESVTDCLIRRDHLLYSACTNDDALLRILDDFYLQGSQFEGLTSDAKQFLRQKCMYLKKAYEIAVEKMNSITWGKCCSLAILELADMGIEVFKNFQTIQTWNRDFRKLEIFMVPFLKHHRESKLFTLFPEAKELLLRYCLEQSSAGTLNSEAVAAEVRSNIIPNCYEKLNEEVDDNINNIINIEELKKYLGLQKISVSTSWRWLKMFGFDYSEQKKCYFTDGHEREDIKLDRNERFLLDYFKKERYTMRWVQITELKGKELENEIENFPKNCYHNYKDLEMNISMREYHIDTSKILENYIPNADKKYGGSKSVRYTGRPLMMIGQDESTYHQYIFSNKSWKSPSGAAPLLPKSVGEMYMVSGFQSREFGLGNKQALTEEVLKRINEKRQGKKYKSKDDANLLFNSELKPPLEDDPTLRFFRSGRNCDGFWTSSHMKIQVEDIIDVLQELYPEFDFLFLFDQSSGHTKMKHDGLNADKMNVSFGSKEKIRDTVVAEVGTYLSTHRVGDVHLMHFVEKDDGPFWLTTEERIVFRNDKPLLTTTEKEKTKVQLLIDLRKSGFDTTKRRYLKGDLVDICKTQNIPIKYFDGDFIPGWMGKQKGMLQVLYERGYIDITKVKSARSMRYSKDGKKTDLVDGALTYVGKQFSLKFILKNCSDFKNEKTDLEHLCNDLSEGCINKIGILFTPKFHCEIAGEGIEYSWGVSKRIYRKYSFQEKRSFQNFVKLVKESLDKVSIQMCRRFSAKARRYMVGYYHQWKEETVSPIAQGPAHIMDDKSSLIKNERIQKMYKSHRDTNCTDGAFIESVMSECIRL